MNLLTDSSIIIKMYFPSNCIIISLSMYMYILLYLNLFITLSPLLYLSLWLPIYLLFFSLSNFNFIIIRWNLNYSLEVLLTRFKWFFSCITFTIPSQLFFFFSSISLENNDSTPISGKILKSITKVIIMIDFFTSLCYLHLFFYFSYFLCLVFLSLPFQFTFYAFIHLFYH